MAQRVACWLYIQLVLLVTVNSGQAFTPRPESRIYPSTIQNFPASRNDDDKSIQRESDIASSESELSRRNDSKFSVSSRRNFLTSGIAAASALVPVTATTALDGTQPSPNKDSYYWPYWGALPVFPFQYRRTLMRQVVESSVWIFDQLIGIYYVHVPIRMTVVALHKDDPQRKGLLVYAPVAATDECLNLLQPLIDQYGPIRSIILPTVAVEHKVLAGPFARRFPDADFYVTDRQYSFPLNLPDRTLGLPAWTQSLPPSSNTDGGNSLWWTGECEHEVLTVKPGVGSMYQDVALWHKASRTLLVCDALFATTADPPAALVDIPEYRRALLFHARDTPDELPSDTIENRQKGWRRIVLLFNFFFPTYSAKVDLGIRPLLALDASYPWGWAGWMPFEWKSTEKELEAFRRYSADGKPTIYTIVQIILSRGNSGEATLEWVNKVASWDFDKVIPAHLEAPLAIAPNEFSATYNFIREGSNQVRYCDEDVALLRAAEQGSLKFSVYPSKLGVLRGQDCRP